MTYCATFLIILVEYALGNRVGWSIEPSLGLSFGAAQGPRRLRRAASDLHSIDPHRDGDTAADVGAPPLAIAAPEFFTDLEITEPHRCLPTRRFYRFAKNIENQFLVWKV
jgi:hypothetical protein